MTAHPFARRSSRLWSSLAFALSAAMVAVLPWGTPSLDVAAARGAEDQPDLKPGSMSGRRGEARARLLKEGGGNVASEKAVVEGLKWLVRHQHADGHWGMHDFDKAGKCNCGNPGVSGHDLAGTAFALLPFLGAGETHDVKDENNTYAKVVEKGLAWMVKHQSADGQLGDGYSHALGTWLLCEAYGLTADPKLKPFAQRAVNKIVDWQGPDGGFRYGPKQPGDLSVSGWHIRAIQSAQLAGLLVPRATLNGVDQFLDKVSGPGGATYGYTSGQGGGNYRLSAVGLLSRQERGWKPTEGGLVRGVELMQKLPPGPNPRDMYYYHYATEVMHHMSAVMPESWGKWNVPMRDMLIKAQDTGATAKKPDQKGSWDSTGDPFNQQLGRLGYTSLCLLTLEVYYRHVPLYAPDKGEKKDGK